MNNLHNQRYDEIKDLLKKTKLILEDGPQINVAKDIEKKISQDTDYETFSDGKKPVTKKEKTQRYRISGGILALHGTDKNELDITSEEKIAFQETMDEFVNDVSDLADFNPLNVYKNSVEWSGKLIDEDLEFILTIGEDSGIYINGELLKVDEEFLSLINDLQQFYQKFKSKWGKILASRKKTTDVE